MLKERRKYIRMDAAIDFTYKIKEGNGAVRKAITKNISPGGIQGFVGKDIKKGTWLELDIKIPTVKEPISAIAKVVWTADEKAGKIDAGIKFEAIDPEVKNKYLEYVCELMFSQLERMKV